VTRPKDADAALNVLVGAVMRATGGRASAPAARAEIIRQLEGRRLLREYRRGNALVRSWLPLSRPDPAGLMIVSESPGASSR
jgi:hypothetical protein